MTDDLSESTVRDDSEPDAPALGGGETAADEPSVHDGDSILDEELISGSDTDIEPQESPSSEAAAMAASSPAPAPKLTQSSYKRESASASYDDDSLNSSWRPHISYIIAHVVLAVLLIISLMVWAFGKGLMQAYGLPMYYPSVAVLTEIGLLLILGYWQLTYTKRFRIGSLISGIITVLEAGVLFYYANPVF